MSRDILPLTVEAVDPWENVQIDPATRRLAERAAAAACLSVEEWLERAICCACPSAFLAASLTIPAMPVATLIFAAPVAPLAAAPAEPTASIRRATTIADLVAQQRCGETKEQEGAPQVGDARDAEPESKRNGTKRLAPIAVAIALAITAGAVTAQYLVPDRTRAPAAPSDNSTPSSLTSLPPTAVVSPAASSSETSAAPATAAEDKAATAEAPMPHEAEPAQTASGTILVRRDKDGVAPTDPKALAPWLEERAKSGDAIAQYRLGVLYALGQGVRQDYQHAAELFKTSAENGVAEAQYNIGVMYGNGLDIGRDPAEAAQWYQKAATQGNANAAFNLGVAYSSGVGVRQSMDQAAQWFQRAAAVGVVNAQFNLGLLYERGDGVPVSQVEAYAWYSAAAARGDTGATLRRDHLSSTLGPATLKEAQARAQQIAATIKTSSKSVDGLATGAVTTAAAPNP